MRIAMPMYNGAPAQHFGHAGEFLLFDVEDGKVTAQTPATPPSHAPGALPQWLRESGVDVVLAGGMGSRAQMLFDQAGIEVVSGVEGVDPAAVVQAYLAGALQAGENLCDH